MESTNFRVGQGEFRLGFLWVVANVVGWIVGFFICEAFQALFRGLSSDGLILGTSLGIAQALVMRPRLGRGGWWVLSSIGGFWLGKLVGDMLSAGTPGIAGFLLDGAVIGAGVGIAQSLVLRGRLPQFGFWIPANIVGWAVAWIVIRSVDDSEPITTLWIYAVGSVGAAIAGIVTGVTLICLMRRRPA